MKKAHAITRICATLGMARSTYYGKKSTPKCTENMRLMHEIRIIHRQTRATYGRRRMCAELVRRGFSSSAHQTRKLMKQAGLRVRMPQPPRFPKAMGKTHAIAPNRLDRQFHVTQAGTVFAGDITYIHTKQGWLYLSVVMDLYARKIVGWAHSTVADAKLVTRALQLALPQRNPSQTLMFHSDQGSQYTSKAFTDMLQKHRITQSMSRRGNCWDNAPVERFFCSLKQERIRKQTYANHLEAKQDINDYIAHFYNTTRLHSAAGYQPPAVKHAENQQTT